MQTPPWAHSPAAERNQGPILAALQALLAPGGNALEISASGTGSTQRTLAPPCPAGAGSPLTGKTICSRRSPGWRAQRCAAGIAAAAARTVTQAQWPSEGEPFSTPFRPDLLRQHDPHRALGMLRGTDARRRPPPGRRRNAGAHGPYLEQGVLTSPGNLAFYAWPARPK